MVEEDYTLEIETVGPKPDAFQYTNKETGQGHLSAKHLRLIGIGKNEKYGLFVATNSNALVIRRLVEDE